MQELLNNFYSQLKLTKAEFCSIPGLSPEHSVSVAEPSDSQMSSENSSLECPDELYNLTKLAEVAVATGQILEQHRLKSSSSVDGTPSFTYTHKLFDKSSRTTRPHLLKVKLY